jgi:CspA family cold shock protein
MGLVMSEEGAKGTGTVKWFNDAKGYGFISSDSGGDLFVHFKSIKGDGFRTLKEGQKVTFVAKNGPKGLQAEDVVADGAATTPSRHQENPGRSKRQSF